MDALKNFAYSLVATPPSPATSGTSLVVTAGQGALFPAAPFDATIWPAGVQPLSTNAEIVRVTAVSTDTFTITRAQYGTTAQSITAGYQIAQTITANLLNQLNIVYQQQSTVRATSTSTFTPVIGSYYPVDTTSGAISVTMPTGIGGGSVIGFQLKAGTNALTINAGSGQTINGFSSITLTAVGQSIYLQYYATGATWEILSGVEIPASATGFTAGGDLTGNFPNPTLVATGTAGTYGSATAVPSITTDSNGRVTSVTTSAPLDATKLPLAGGTMSGAIAMGGNGITGSGEIVATDFKVTGLTGATASSSRLVGTTTSGAPTSGTFTAGDIVADQTGTFWLCVSSGTPGTWTNEIPNSLVNRSATATAGVGEFTIYGTSGTSGQTITLPANPQNGAIYQIKNLSPYTVNILGGTNSISVSGTVYGAATPYTIPLNAAYSFAFSGGVWYCFLTTDLAKQSGVLPIANGGTNSATGALPLTGDVTGTATASVVGAIQGKSISSTQATLLSQMSNIVTHTTASNPPVTAGEFSVVPSAGVTGALTLTLPSVPANGTINYIFNQNVTYSITLAAGGSDKIQNGASSVSSLSLAFLYPTCYTIEYYNGFWYAVAGPFNGIQGSGASVFATSPTLTTPTLNVPTLKSALETAYVDTTALNGTYNVYVSTNGSLILNTGTPSANFTFNVASTSSVALNTLLAVGGAVTFTVLVTNGSSNAYYLTGISVDGTSQTVNWQGGSAPSTPALSTMYAYTVTIIKTAASTYTVLASQTQF